jgi:hypothetical protein
MFEILGYCVFMDVLSLTRVPVECRHAFSDIQMYNIPFLWYQNIKFYEIYRKLVILRCN